MQELIREFLEGPRVLREAIAGLSPAELDATPIPGKWSIRQVVCHIADFEPVYADRMKRVIAEDRPLLLSGDPDRFAERLAYSSRDIETELRLTEAVRQQMAAILATLPESDFQRVGQHSRDGELTLETLLRRITGHISHHVGFIHEKRAVLR